MPHEYGCGPRRLPFLSTLFSPIAALLALAIPTAAGKTADADGWVAVAFHLRNASPAPMLCQAQIAHWFSLDLARVAPGASTVLDLRVNTRSTTWAALNAHGEALPVERAWCGFEGQTYETRWDLGLGGKAPQTRQLDCFAEGGTLRCE